MPLLLPLLLWICTVAGTRLNTELSLYSVQLRSCLLVIRDRVSDEGMRIVAASGSHSQVISIWNLLICQYY